MSCSTCDGYEFVPNEADPEGAYVDCPDCRAVDDRPLTWCPVHSRRVALDGSCVRCAAEAAAATAKILGRVLHDQIGAPA